MTKREMQVGCEGLAACRSSLRQLPFRQRRPVAGADEEDLVVDVVAGVVEEAAAGAGPSPARPTPLVARKTLRACATRAGATSRWRQGRA